MSLFEWLDKLDRIAFILIHRDSDYLILDQILPFLRNPFTWLPLYCYLFYFICSKYKEKALLFILFSILTIAIADRLSAGLFKPLFERPRPCFDAALQPLIRDLVECGGLYSFHSSHAANHVGLATFWYLSIKTITGKSWYWLWIWALLICYAQVYVGKHYPLDIAAGSFLGLMTGTTLAKIFEHWGWWRKTLFRRYFPARQIQSDGASS